MNILQYTGLMLMLAAIYFQLIMCAKQDVSNAQSAASFIAFALACYCAVFGTLNQIKKESND